MGDFSEALARRFAEANLRAEVNERRSAAEARGRLQSADIFVMTIAGRGREEYFRLWRGAPGNRVEAEGIDRRLGQLVLLVHEPERTFVERRPRPRRFLDRTALKVVGEDERFVWIERHTDARKRHFLVGRDERQLFICQLPRAVTTVRDAHLALRAPGADPARGPVRRQGEWFFLEPTAAELAALEAALRALRTAVRSRVPIGRGGHPHVADELVVVPPAPEFRGAVPPLVLVRGRVRHVDHDTLRLRDWCKVVRNAEPLTQDGLARMDGVAWID
jgi:hypothetical protein